MDDDLHAALASMPPKARDTLRRVLIRDQADRDAISPEPMRYREGGATIWADIIDLLTLHPDARRHVVRLLAEIDATNRGRAESPACSRQALRGVGHRSSPSCSRSQLGTALLTMDAADVASVAAARSSCSSTRGSSWYTKRRLNLLWRAAGSTCVSFMCLWHHSSPGALADRGLVTIEQVGRQRRYRLSGPEVAHAMESLAALAPTIGISSLRQATKVEQLRRARTCYDHLAGRLGVAVTERLVSGRALRRTGEAFELTRSGRTLLEGIGVDVDGARRRKRGFALACQDWTERRSHLGGALGAAVCDRLIELAWIRRRPGGRAVILTDEGTERLASSLGVELEP